MIGKCDYDGQSEDEMFVPGSNDEFCNVWA